MKKKVVLFLPMLIALLDVVIEFAIPTNEVINTNGVHYFGYLMLIIAGIYLILGIRACISNTYWCHYYGKIKFHSVAIAFLGLIEIFWHVRLQKKICLRHVHYILLDYCS